MATRRSWGGRFANAAAALLLVSLVLGAGCLVDRGRNARPALLAAGVAVRGDGTLLPLEEHGARASLYSGTRVLRGEPFEAAEQRASEQREWLASGRVPGRGGRYEDLAVDALLDLHTLGSADGAVPAALSGPWRYVWPRDSALVAVALSQTGHQRDAVRVMEHLQRLQPSTGIFQARYVLDGSGPPDARGEQSDGTGYVLWATAQLAQNERSAADARSMLHRLRPLIDSSTRAVMRLTSSASRLPPVSQDYWEVPAARLSLGTAAPLAAGLDAAASTYASSGIPDVADSVGARAAELRDAIRSGFGRHGYPRYLGGGGRDASIALMLPPFAQHAEPSVVSSWQLAAQELRRPAGGLAPGTGWRHDGISWTPATAMFALVAASTGDRARATRWLDWLDRHRTRYGALPEKVLSNGRPAGPAPLAVTDALVLMALTAVDGAQ